jgi:uncharacterized protein YndB with AHSA1/START domain
VSDERATSAVVRRVLPARPEVVFDEWLDPDALAEFICPAPTRAGIVECDGRVGGQLRVDMVDVDRVVHVTGEYLEVDRPRRLRFTWITDFGGGFDSVVTVTFEPHGERDTLMTIDHAELPPGWRDDHEQGWGTIASQLAARLA